MRLADKVAVVTGGSSGIGRSISLLFAKEGARVAIVARDSSKASDVLREITKQGGNAVFVKADVCDEEQTKAMVNQVVEKYGKIHILVNDAGRGLNKPIAEITEEEWEAVMDVNVKGVFFCTKHVLPKLIETGSGSIVNISSVAALFAVPNMAAYSTSKGALISMTRSVALDYAKYHIRANCICPTSISTPLFQKNAGEFAAMKGITKEQLLENWDRAHPLGRLGQPEDVANAALFLASDESAFITGVSLLVDGGRTVSPPTP